jgi:four helix bundle protein
LQIEKCKLQISDGNAPPATSRQITGERLVTPADMSDRFLDFADRVCSVVDSLPDTRLGRRIADQLLRSGTSPLGNYEEACAAESKNDFVHKLGICLKEIRESRAWLRLISRRNMLPATRLGDLIDESEQLGRIVGQSIATVRRTSKKKPRH